MDWFAFGSPFVAFWVLPVPYSRVLGSVVACNQIFLVFHPYLVRVFTPCDAANTPRETEDRTRTRRP